MFLHFGEALHCISDFSCLTLVDSKRLIYSWFLQCFTVKFFVFLFFVFMFFLFVKPNNTVAEWNYDSLGLLVMGIPVSSQTMTEMTEWYTLCHGWIVWIFACLLFLLTQLYQARGWSELMKSSCYSFYKFLSYISCNIWLSMNFLYECFQV